MEQTRFKRKTVTMEILQSQQEKKSLRRTVFYIGLFLIVTAVFLTVSFAVFFKVRTININGNNRYSNEEIIESLQVKTEDNLYSFKTEDIEKAIKRKFPYVASVQVSRKIPSSLNIKITETDAAMYISLEGGYYLLSRELRVLDRITDEKNLPNNIILLMASAVQRCIVGETASFVDTRSYDAVTELYRNITDNNITSSVETINIISRFDIYLQYEDRFSVYIGDMESSDIKVQFLTGIIAELGDNDKGSIDVSNHADREATVALS